ncbi:putative bifunctional diguanylate cyclase/phosphodiesterase [Sediminibacillus halophilus]|uniref:Polar amino acid transport system substrate-binding protein n=1 Tax=Sediminibacillus halophilus TaxID=482461 RepID=A0A1G9MZH2_9BACI|nr:GGDEF domain-containing phosphodiesterase [Sediminibacillus halophilus]SDL79716.1 polar amino acid transport system substrate-binding protein [Sediminibacillus halophilus]
MANKPNNIEKLSKHQKFPSKHRFLHQVAKGLEECKTAKRSLTVLFIGLDSLRQIFHTYNVKDEKAFLRQCADRIQISYSEIGVAEGGEGLLLLIDGLYNMEVTERAACDVIEAFSEPLVMNGTEIFLSVSLGICQDFDRTKSPNELIRGAEMASTLIREKPGSNFHFFSPDILTTWKNTFNMEFSLRKALKGNQFELHYQPQKDIKSGNIVGCEALLRWKHPDKGYIPPDRFIPLAEKNGMMIELGEWVLREACRQNKKWHSTGTYRGLIGVNLSARQLHQPELAEKIKNILEETGLSAEYLELEITESAAISQNNEVLNSLKQLRELGVHVSIDDFGTGYSSLKYLSIFPISKLKIDKLFMKQEVQNNQAIVKSIITMSHSMEMKVIAEGVETEEQLVFLEKENCDEVQGYYFYKPLPLQEASELFLQAQ